jgi:hypothetical protein
MVKFFFKICIINLLLIYDLIANQVNQSLYKDNFLDKKLFINFGYFRQTDIYYTDNYYYDYDFFNNKNNVIYLEGEFKILSLMDKKINLYSKADYLFYNKYSYSIDNDKTILYKNKFSYGGYVSFNIYKFKERVVNKLNLGFMLMNQKFTFNQNYIDENHYTRDEMIETIYHDGDIVEEGEIIYNPSSGSFGLSYCDGGQEGNLNPSTNSNGDIVLSGEGELVCKHTETVYVSEEVQNTYSYKKFNLGINYFVDSEWIFLVNKYVSLYYKITLNKYSNVEIDFKLKNGDVFNLKSIKYDVTNLIGFKVILY